LIVEIVDIGDLVVMPVGSPVHRLRATDRWPLTERQKRDARPGRRGVRFQGLLSPLALPGGVFDGFSFLGLPDAFGGSAGAGSSWPVGRSVEVAGAC
jgi:hypothetical protein